jgi:hypothetical protein
MGVVLHKGVVATPLLPLLLVTTMAYVKGDLGKTALTVLIALLLQLVQMGSATVQKQVPLAL